MRQNNALVINRLEFPAVGYRYPTSGSLLTAGTWGYYWSSFALGSGSAYGLWFSSSDLTVDSSNRQYGLSVRCVR
ncbi:MAG: fibrobacter succinogenes major paralogous domain-containing protein [Rikenellaceae bacterium]|nr:fibrobacter succinogenes major paralogous domain-containing protein [Rikenellaceae bacterium]